MIEFIKVTYGFLFIIDILYGIHCIGKPREPATSNLVIINIVIISPLIFILFL